MRISCSLLTSLFYAVLVLCALSLCVPIALHAQPFISVYSPARNTTSTVLGADIELTWSEAMNTGTLTSGTVWVYGSQTGLYSTSATYSYSAGNTVLTVTPAIDFKPGELVSISVTNAQNASNTPMTRASVWSFYAEGQGGPGTFFNRWAEYNGIELYAGIGVGDLDGDGDVDMFGVALESGGVVWLNDGSGSFTNTWAENATTFYSCMALGDLDGDGDLDVFEGNWALQSKVWSNDGNGNFTNTWTQSGGGTFTLCVALGDLDGDGDLDVFEGHAGSNKNNRVWLNDGSGNFANTWTQSSSATNTISLALGDLDGDGDLDVFEGNQSQPNKVWLNDGSGNFSVAWTQSSGTTGTASIALGDFDGDGDLDMFEGNSSDNNKVWLNDGSGNFSAAWTQSSGTTGTLSIAVGDFDGDGDLDVFEVGNNGADRMWSNDGSGNFTNTWTRSDGGVSLSCVAVGDVDGDGDIDIFGGANGSGVWINATAPVVESFTPTTNALHVASTEAITIAFSTTMNVSTLTSANIQISGNQTGLYSTSAIAYNSTTNSITLTPAQEFKPGELITVGVTTGIRSAENVATTHATVWSFIAAVQQGLGAFESGWQQSSGAGNTNSITMGDVDGDGDIDVVEGDFGGNNKVWSNDGSGNFTNTWTQSSGAATTKSIALGDFDGDGDLDMFEGIYNANNRVWSNDGSGNFTNTWTQSGGSTYTYSIAIGDMDGDGDIDVFEGNYNGQMNKVWLNNGNGSFVNTWTQSSGATSSYGIVLGDLDNDGDLDMFEGNWSAGNKVWLNDGSGNFANTWTQISGTTGTRSIALGDVDGDGDVDVFEGNSTGDNKVWLNDGSGNFANTWTQSSDLRQTRSIVLGDFDGDGDVDAYEGTYSENNRVWQNDGSGNFTSTWEQYSGASNTQCLAVGDLDGDGDVDVYEGNYAQNNAVWMNAPPPFVDSFVPTRHALHVASTATVSIRFSTTMNESTLTSANIQIAGSQTGLYSTSAVVYNSTTNTIVLTPVTNFKPGEVVTVSITTGVRSLAGLYATRATTWSFTVAATEASAVFNGTTNIVVAGSSETRSVAFGDVNRDGYLDFAAVLRGSNAVSVYLGDGMGNFTSSATVSVGTGPLNVTLGDVNNDGYLDIATANYYTKNISIRLGDGTGGFSTTTDIPVGRNPYQAAIGDVNGDGFADIVSANSGDDNISISLGDGLGGFGDTTNIAVGASPQSVALGDINNDGYPDIAVANSDENTVSIRLGNGAGSFSGNTSIPVGNSPWSLVLSDVNEDGYLDIAVANRSGNSVSIRLGDGLGNFSGTTNVPTGSLTSGLALGDVNGDGHIDIAAANQSSKNVSIRLGDGLGNFSGTTNIPIGDGFGVALGDVNGDGRLDIAAAHYVDGIVSIRFGLPAPSVLSFTPSANALAVETTATIRVGFDMGMDASTLTGTNIRIMGSQTGLYSTSAIVYSSTNNTVELTPSMGFKPGELITVEVTTKVKSAAGAPMAQSTLWSFTVTAHEGEGTFFAGWVQSGTETNVRVVAAGDLDGDGDVDVFEGYQDGENRVWLNDGSGNFTNTWTQSGGATNTSCITLGDLDGDGDLDAFEGNKNDENNKVWLNDGSGNFTNTWMQSTAATYTTCIALGDLDGDGDIDVFEGNSSDVSVQFNKVWSNDGSGNFTNTWTQSGDTAWARSIVLGDLDGDGDIDAFEGNSTIGNKVWSNNGSGSFTNTWTQSSGVTMTSTVGIGDLDGDGDIDVFEGNNGENNRVWSNDGSGNFTNTWTQSGDFTNTIAIALADLDGDGDIDVFEGSQQDSSKVWSNNGSGNLANTWTQSAAATNITSLAVGDLDGDGDIDIYQGHSLHSSFVWLNGHMDVVLESQSTTATASGNNVSFTVQLQTEHGAPFTVSQGSKLFVLSSDNPQVQIVGTTQATVEVGQHSTTLTVQVNNTTSLAVTTSLTIRLMDGQNLSTTAILTVGANRAPQVSTSATAISLLEDGSTRLTVLLWDAETTTSSLFISATSGNITLLSNTSITQVGATGATTSLEIYPATNATGVVEVWVAVSDGLNSAVTSFTVSIVPVNDAPSFATGANVVVLEDSGAYGAAFATGLDDGDPETTQTLSFVVNNDNNALFAVQPVVSSTTGNLSFTPAANANGMAVVTVYIQDDGGTSNGGVNTSATQTFVISVTPVNDAPNFATGANVTVLEDSGVYSAAFATGLDDGDPETMQTLSFVVNNDNNVLFAVQPAVSGTTGNLSFTPAANANGMAVVTVYIQDDGGTSDGGVNTSATQTFVIGVAPVNDAPSFATTSNIVVLDEDGAQTVANHLVSISTGPADEAGQNVQFFVSNDNNALFAVQPAISSTGTLSFTPAHWAQGVATVSVYAQDDGGTSDGGVNTSATLSFAISVGLSPATHLRMVGMNPVLAQSGETVQVTVASYTALGTQRATTANTTVGLLWDATSLPMLSGSTQAMLVVGSSEATISVSLFSSSTANITIPAVVEAVGGVLVGTTMSITVQHAVPSGLAGTTDDIKVSLSWVAPVAQNVTGYAVYRGTDPLVLAEIGTTTATAYTDNSVMEGPTYYYSVKSVATGLRSGATAPIAVVMPVRVASLTASALDNGAQLQWTASTTAGVTGYEIYHGLTSGSLTLLGTVGAGMTTYSHVGLDDGLRHYYGVKTLIGSIQKSAISGEASTVPNTFRLLYPNGGEVVAAGTKEIIRWQYSGDISSMRIEYSTDNGGSWTSIAQVVTLAGNKPLTTFSQEWIVENTPTTTALVRVVSVTPSGIADASDGVFTIQAIAPPTSLMATAGSTTISLSWTASTSASVAGYRVLRGTTTSSMSAVASIGATTGYTDASVDVCTQYYYAVQTLVGNYASANSNVAGARIALPESLTVLSPNGGESWQVGVTRSITWTSTACTVPSMVTLEYSSNNGGSWSTIATVANTGSYAWSLPNAASAQALVRVSGNALSDQSDAVFTIAPIPAPSGLAATAGDGSVGLSWTASSAEGLSGYGIWRGTTSGNLSLLTTVGSATTNYTDNSVANCTLYVYSVTAMVGSYHSASSNEAEAVPQITPALALTSPNGGESWQVGVMRNIMWTSTACTVPSMVTLEYSVNNGGSWSTIATVTNTGSYVWSIPNAASAQALVRVSGNDLSGQSDAVFTIAPTPAASGLAATAGDGSVGLSWTASSAEGLSGYGIWRGTTSGSLSLLSTVGTATTSYTDNSVTNCTLYVYGVTAMVGSYHSASSNEAGAAPQITPALVLTSPNGGEQWRMYLPYVITWTSTGCSVPSTVNIELSLNNGGSWTSVANAAANTGSYTWTPMGMSPSAQALIRISGGALQDQSDSVFELLPRPYPSATASPIATSATYCADSSIPNLGTVLSLSDDYFSATALVVEVSSSNPALLPVSGIAQTSSTGATTSFAFTPVQNVAGTADVTFTVRNAVESTVTTTVSVSVVVHALPSAVITGSTSACANTGGYTYSVPSEAGGTYAWTVVGGSVTSGAGTREIAVEWGTAGAGSVNVVVMNSNGCSATSLKGVYIHANPVPSIAVSGATTFCSGGSVVLTALPSGMSYLWSNGATAQSIEVAQSGSYSVMVTNQYGCSAQSSAVGVTALPSISLSVAGDTTMCAGNSTQLHSSVSSAVGGLSFAWSPSTGLSNASVPHPVASPLVTTTYTLLVTDANGCSTTGSVTVTVIPAPATNISSNATICEGGSTQLLATGGTNYSWSPTVGLSDASIANPTASPSTTTTYVVTISSVGSCPVQRSVTVTVEGPPVAGVSSDVEVCAGNGTQLVATGGTSYSWSPTVGLSDASIADPIANPLVTTTYSVTVSNAGGCSSTASVTVTVKPVTLYATVYLEGGYSGGSMPANLQAQGLLPENQPYNVAPYNYAGTEVLNVPSGTAVVDWVLVDLRSSTGSGSLVERRAALLLSDGSIVNSDGGLMEYPGISANSHYVVVWHRNHIGVMSARAANVTGLCSMYYNFTLTAGSVFSSFGNGQKQLGAGAYGMASGDANGDGIVNAVDRVTTNNAGGNIGYLLPDVSLDGIVNAIDRVLVRNNAFWVTQVP